VPSWLAQFTKLGHPAAVLITPDELSSLDILSYDETLKEILEAQAQRLKNQYTLREATALIMAATSAR
jgi:hypothetical protein